MILIRTNDNASLVYDITSDSFIFSRASGQVYKESRESFLASCNKNGDDGEKVYGVDFIGQAFIDKIPKQFSLVQSIVKTNTDTDTLFLFDRRANPPAKKCAICGETHEYLFFINGEFVCQDCLPSIELCAGCGKVLKIGSRRAITHKGKRYCKECCDTKFKRCPTCGEFEFISDFQEVYHHERSGTETRQVCRTCYDQKYVECEDCGKRYSRSSMHDVCNHGYVCPDCIDSDGYMTCHNCGEWFLREETREDRETGFVYCRSCYSETHRTIHSHWSKLSPIFHGEGPLFFGIEQEIDDGHDQECAAEDIMAALGKKELYIETDGSLNDEGLELVYFPRTWGLWQEFRPMLDKVQEIATEYDYKSHDTTTCGLHIHASRNAIKSSEFPDVEENVGKIIALYENNYEDFVKFSRRHTSELEHWAKRNSYRMRKGEQKKGYVMASQGDRYKAVNVQNEKTIEFRFFRGSLAPSTVLASINLVKNMIEIAVSTNSDDIDMISFDGILKMEENPIIAEYWTNLRKPRRA